QGGAHSPPKTLAPPWSALCRPGWTADAPDSLSLPGPAGTTLGDLGRRVWPGGSAANYVRRSHSYRSTSVREPRLAGATQHKICDSQVVLRSRIGCGNQSPVTSRDRGHTPSAVTASGQSPTGVAVRMHVRGRRGCPNRVPGTA